MHCTEFTGGATGKDQEKEGSVELIPVGEDDYDGKHLLSVSCVPSLR